MRRACGGVPALPRLCSNWHLATACGSTFAACTDARAHRTRTSLFLVRAFLLAGRSPSLSVPIGLTLAAKGLRAAVCSAPTSSLRECRRAQRHTQAPRATAAQAARRARGLRRAPGPVFGFWPRVATRCGKCPEVPTGPFGIAACPGCVRPAVHVYDRATLELVVSCSLWRASACLALHHRQGTRSPAGGRTSTTRQSQPGAGRQGEICHAWHHDSALYVCRAAGRC